MRVRLHVGNDRRGDGYLLADPHPVPRYKDCVYTGNPAQDGYTLLSRSEADAQGDQPSAGRTVGRAYRGPSQDWEW